MSVWPASRAGPAFPFSPEAPYLPFLLPPPAAVSDAISARAFTCWPATGKTASLSIRTRHSQLDPYCPDAVQAALVRAVALFGPLRVRINNGAVSHFCKPLALTVARQAFLAGNAGPGWIHTGDAVALSAEDHARHPSGRAGRPDNALLACFFLADAANDVVNGVNLPVDGGMTRRTAQAPGAQRPRTAKAPHPTDTGPLLNQRRLPPIRRQAAAHGHAAQA